jgi:peroxiredoxin
MKSELTMIATLLALVAVSSSPASAFDSLDDVMKHMPKPDPAPLKAYLAEHPDAPDADQAERVLAAVYMATGHADEAIRIFERRYERMLAQKDAWKERDIRDAIRDLLDACSDAGERERARAAIARIERDFAGDKNEKAVLTALVIPRDQLKMPILGEAMDIEFTALDGREVDLAALKGKVVLVEYWATWCAPCVAEIPTIQKVYEKFHEQGFEVVGISLDTEREKLDQFVKQRKIPWPQSFTGGSDDHFKFPLVAKYGIHSVPALFLLGRDGKVAAVNPRGPGELERHVSALLAKEVL